MATINFDFVCSGYSIENNNTRKFYYVVRRGGAEHECLIYADNGQIVSAYNNVVTGTSIDEYCYINKDALTIYKNICSITKGFTNKNGVPTMHTVGAAVSHTYDKKGKQAKGVKYMNEAVEVEFRSENLVLVLSYIGRVDTLLAKGQNFTDFGLGDLYVKLEKQKIKATTQEEDLEVIDEADVPIRSLEEIALDKDITWLHNKKYYVVNDEDKAEQIFKALEAYDGVISYDVETSGLHINMFGQIGSPRRDELKKWNDENPKESIKADYLVGFSFTVEKNTGFYFPCAHRKFKNIYQDRIEGSIGLKLANLIKSLYTVGQYRDRNDYMAQYIRKTPAAEIPCDVLLMERCRYIFETKKILAFNGIFEWKTTWLYSIDLNLKEDPMILHQLLYKFKRERVRTGGEPSNLKYLTKVECGVEQLDLADFFIGYKEDESNVLRAGSASGASKTKKKSKKGLNIDFSYMDLRGTQAYAPADVDFALAIWEKYKYDLIHNYPEMEYIYGVEIVMAMAVAYAEFYGLRINESKIEAVRKKNLVDICLYEHEFRKLVGLAGQDEVALIEQLKTHLGENEDTADDFDESLVNRINDIIKDKGDLNMGAPGQVGELLYTKYKWPLTEDGKKSMGKKVIKQYEKAVDENGNLMYPEVKWYRKYKDAMTLDSKFFGKLREFTMPGGFMFANFGSISCSTGRMSCRTPNLQQMPKSISKIIEPREGFVFCDADFAQIELRVLVALAHEMGLIEYFFDPDADMHSMLASMLFDLPFAKVDIPDETGKSPRQQCKGLNFGIPYGMGIASLAITLYGAATATTKAWAKDKYNKYAEKMPKVWEFFADVKEHAQVTEFSSTYFGRRRYYKFTDADGNYSSKHVAMALRQAGNAVIQGTAADIFKIAMARIFTFIRSHGLLGRVLMSNFIHDEGLYEIDTVNTNVNEILANIINCQQVQIKGFPPLTVGAGIGKNWAAAKGGMAEINPILGNQIMQQAGSVDPGHTPAEVYRYYELLNENFRKNRIASYIKKEQDRLNAGEVVSEIDPIMAKLMTLAFDNGVEKEMQTEAAAAGLTGEKLATFMSNLDARRLRKFIELNPEMFEGYTITWIDSVEHNMAGVVEEEDDTGYDDEDDEDNEISEYEFAMIDESDTVYGLSVQDIIEMFGLIVSKERGICGIDARRYTDKQLDKIADFIGAHQCNPEDEGAMEFIIMRQNRIILKPGIYVNNIAGFDIEEAARQGAA